MKVPSASRRAVILVAAALLIAGIGATITWHPLTKSTGEAEETRIAVSKGAATRLSGGIESSDNPSVAGYQAGAVAAGSQAGPLLVANQPAAQKDEPAQTISAPVPEDFLKRILSADEKTASIPLPGGGTATGKVTLVQRDGDGLLLVQGDVTAPEAGKFMFQRQTAPGVAGSMVGHIYYNQSAAAYQVRPTGANRSPMLVKVTVDEVICRALPASEIAEGDRQYAPQTHPTNYPIPPSENGIIQLQSLPGATAVVYLDFDGEAENFPNWGYINALPAGSSNAQIFEVWKGIAEDYQPFNINVTTVRAVYDAAPQGRRMQAIFTPTTDAAPGAGGVAGVGSFNSTGHQVCWVFYSAGKSAVEAGSHEIGHTLGLSHDGRISPAEEYYGGHNGWAPIMGVGYYQTISQWSKGEYPSANNTQDDLKIITTNNNSVNYRADDYGSTYATAAWLDIASGGAVSNEGIIETTGDQDAFRFSTSGGNASLNINNVTFNPNLDVMAEILTSAGVVVATSNSDTTTSASFSSLSLAAGDYFLRVTGVGKGDLTTGYSNYGSLGAYLITGTVNGGVAADHLTIAENSAVGSAVGASAPRVSHGGGTLAYSISSGNIGGAFSIDPSSGAITVANSSLLDFETLSTRWDDPASFELFISITDSLGTATESIRTVVTITDVNEAPVFTALAAQKLPENLAIGTVVVAAKAVDPDRTDYVTYSITGGNVGNAFAIGSATGTVTVAGALDFETTPSYTLTIRATDHGSPANIVDTSLVINLVDTVEGYVPGSIIRAFYNGISGSTVANLTSNPKFPNSPDSLTVLTSFDGGADRGDNYGSTIRGYMIPPATGNYTFWISSDDASELRISPDTNPANAVVRGSVATYTSQYVWTTYSSQQSVAIALTAGQPYYIEARHKEGGGGDHLEVAWQGPGMSAREVIPGKWLVPLNTNYAPKISAATYTVRENALPGQAFGIVTSTDVNPTDVSTGYTITAGNTGGVFAIDPATGRLSVAKPGLLNASATPSYSLTIQVTDNGTPPLTGAGTVTVNVIAASGIDVAGIVQEIWTGLSSSTSISTLTGNANYPYKPNVRRVLTSFDSGANYADNYGSRIRAKFIPPSSGDYQFYISSDDDSRLVFSADPAGSGAVQIASVSGWSNPSEWTKFPSQTSAVRTLVAGQAVYLESLHKEGGNGDHVEVGYTGPGAGTPVVIPGSMLQPFDINAAPVFSPSSYSYNVAAAAAGMPVGTVNGTDPNGETLIYAILSGNTQGAFAIGAGTGTITVTNPGLLANGDTTLQIAAQDGGLGGAYPLASAGATVVIHVSSSNTSPVFAENPITRPDATEDIAYNQTIAGTASDADVGDTLTYSKTSGPAWLSVAGNGALTGTPPANSGGNNSFVVRATDTLGAFAEATLNINVIAVNHAPAWAASPFSTPSARVNVAYSGQTLAAFGSDPDAGDAVTFSKINGPSWLTVASNGTLGGTPLPTDLGINSFTVRMTDTAGLFANATLTILVGSNTKADNVYALNLATSWTGGVSPGASDLAAWNGAYNVAGSLSAVLPGTALAWNGIAVGNLTGSAAGLVSIGGTGGATASSALTIGSGGIDMSLANQNLVINSATTVLNGNQSWFVPSGRNLRFGTTGAGSANANVDGSGTIALSGGGMVDLNQGGGTGFSDAAGFAGFSGKWIVGPNTTLRAIRHGATAFGSNTAADTITLSGGALAVGGISGSQGNWTWNSNITLTAATTSTIDQQLFSGNGRFLKLNGAIGGSGNLVFKETGANNSFDNDNFGFIITGANTLSGTVTIGGAAENGISGRLSSVRLGGAAGTDIGTAAGATGSFGSASVLNNGVLTLSRSNAWTFANPMTGTGKLRVGGGVAGSNTQDVTISGDNSYSGGTEIAAGTLRVSTADTALGSGALTFTGSASLATASGGGARTLSNDLSVGSTIVATLDASFADLTLGGVIGGAGGLATTGGGITVLTGNNSYSAGTAVGSGTTLRVDGVHTGVGAVSVAATARLEGGGTLPGTITVNGTLSPGDKIGTLTTGPVIMTNGSTFAWQLSNWIGAAGIGYDKLMATSLNLTSVTTAVTVNLDTVNLTNFGNAAATFTLVQTTGGITGFAANKFVIDASAFPTATGTWAVAQIGNDLLLAYTPGNAAPTFTGNPISGGNASADIAFSGGIATFATDPDAGDTMTFNKIDGPAWLSVAADGTLSGTPGLGDGGSNEFTVRVTDGGGLFAETTLAITVTLTPGQSWRHAHFGADANNPAIAGDLADPDADGLNNLLEYALGLDPKVAGPSGITHDLVAIEQTNYLRLSINRNPDASDVVLTVESCGDLTDWSSATTAIEVATASQLIVRDTGSGARRFIRLKVTR